MSPLGVSSLLFLAFTVTAMGLHEAGKLRQRWGRWAGAAKLAAGTCLVLVLLLWWSGESLNLRVLLVVVFYVAGFLLVLGVLIVASWAYLSDQREAAEAKRLTEGRYTQHPDGWTFDPPPLLTPKGVSTWEHVDRISSDDVPVVREVRDEGGGS